MQQEWRADSESGYEGHESDSKHREGVTLTEGQFRKMMLKHHGKDDCGAIVRFFQLSRGYNNVVYEVKTAEGVHVAVRLSSAKTWPFEKVANEAAALRFLAQQTSIPVPHVILVSPPDPEVSLDWSAMVMSWCEGVVLGPQTWERLAPTAREQLAEEVCDVLQQLQSLRFGTVGALVADTNSASGVAVGQSFDGPIEARGPFEDAAAWLLATVTAYVERNRKYAAIDARVAPLIEFEAAAVAVVERFIADGDLQNQPIVAVHGDFAGRNILINEVPAGQAGRVISAVVDWEWISAGPASSEFARGLDDFPDELEAMVLACVERRGLHGPGGYAHVNKMLDALSPWSLAAHFDGHPMSVDQFDDLIRECVADLSHWLPAAESK